MQPCLLFIDEIEAVVGKRSTDSDSCGVQERILSTLLNELDGVGTVEGEQAPSHVILVAATNRPDMIDTALMRPGRLDQIILVPKPSIEERIAIFKVKLSSIPLSNDVDINILAEQCNDFTGADIENICREAALTALNDDIKCKEIVSN